MKKRSVGEGRATTQSRLLAYFYNFGKSYINEFSHGFKKIQGTGDYFHKWAQKSPKYFSADVMLT